MVLEKPWSLKTRIECSPEHVCHLPAPCQNFLIFDRKGAITRYKNIWIIPLLWTHHKDWYKHLSEVSIQSFEQKKSNLNIWQKRGNNSDIKIFGLSPFCEPIIHIDINICQKFQSNPLSRLNFWQKRANNSDIKIFGLSPFLWTHHTHWYKHLSEVSIQSFE